MNKTNSPIDNAPTGNNPSDVEDELDIESGNQAAQSAADQAYQDYDREESPASEPETRDAEVLRLRREADAADKRVLQAQAEAENFRKRMRRDYEDQLKFASMPLVEEILQVRDNLIRAIEAAHTSADTPVAEGLREGVLMVVKQLDDTLGKYGVERIPAQGEEFDPNFHEAISQMPHPEIESGRVAHVATEGFRMHGRVIRPTQVVVSTGGE